MGSVLSAWALVAVSAMWAVYLYFAWSGVDRALWGVLVRRTV